MFKTLLQDKFMMRSAIYFTGSMVVALLNYLYHPILSRMMSVEDFGEVQTIISLFLQTVIVIGMLRLVVINLVVNEKDPEKTKGLISGLQKVAFLSVAFLSLIIAVLHNHLAEFFQFQSSWPFIALAGVLLVSVSVLFREAVLQGRQDFLSLSISQILLAFGRLVFAVALVALGWSTFGAITAIIFAYLLALTYLIPRTRGVMQFSLRGTLIDPKVVPELKFGAIVLFVSLGITFLYTADIVLIKHFFAEDIAGGYSGVSVVARIIYFITAPMTAVMLSSVKIKATKRKNGLVLLKALGLVLVLGGGVLGVFTLFSEMIIYILVGEQYVAYAQYLPRISIAMLLAALSNLIVNYFLALRDFRVLYVSIASMILLALLSYVSHETIIDIIDNFIFASLVTIVLLATLFMIKKQKIN